ncbi:50S ribosomal protein L15e [Candidatus Woesearchaeota archaeon]|nr:50S ribosomal protein L15e [Candidatus Woesearchaeota archaeon]
MGLYQHIRETWKKPQEGLAELWNQRLLAWRSEPVTVKLERPTRLDRARSLGYKAKQGIIVVRQRVLRGGHTRPQIKRRRRPRHSGLTLSLRKSYQLIAEERAQQQFENLTVLNSYWVGQDGKHYWYEVILVDSHHPVIQSDPSLNWITKAKNQSRVFHGKTSAGRKSRGMRGKGEGFEKSRPSRRAHLRRQ